MFFIGYGDAYPISALGKFVASLAIVFGILIFIFPISVLGSTFLQSWAKSREHKHELSIPNEEDLSQLLKEFRNEFHHFKDTLTTIETNLDALNESKVKLEKIMEILNKKE